MGDDCIFCLVAKGQDKENKILKENEELVCFQDIFPAAPHHYLVITKEHIHSCLSLQWQQHSLVERMAEMGKAVLKEQGVSDMADVRLGFHIPPFTSVDHLHLHVLAPSTQISEYMKYKFKRGERYMEVDDFLKALYKCSKDTTVEEDCHFCQIAANKSDTEILFSDEELVCIRDLKPGATHHYLIITRKHIVNCKALRSDNIQIVEQMRDMGMNILKMNKVSDLDDIRMGFHLPPFSSVPHLHLHILAPASQMSNRSMLRYGPQSHWFITVETVISQLNTQGNVK